MTIEVYLWQNYRFITIIMKSRAMFTQDAKSQNNLLRKDFLILLL